MPKNTTTRNEQPKPATPRVSAHTPCEMACGETVCYGLDDLNVYEFDGVTPHRCAQASE